MGFKIKNLEHIDGKVVKHSTVTTQHPEIFVKRKKNTGEWIITSDTISEYGMHHIYLGGEHIAGGYGFATTKTRDDLCYVQETYNGIFNYFNNAYSYAKNKIGYINNFDEDFSSYVLNAINYNTYLNTSVDLTYNTVSIKSDNTSYNFKFNKGVLYVTENDFIQYTLSDNNTVLQSNNTKYAYIYSKDNSSIVLLSSLLKDYYPVLTAYEYISNNTYGKYFISNVIAQPFSNINGFNYNYYNNNIKNAAYLYSDIDNSAYYYKELDLQYSYITYLINNSNNTKELNTKFSIPVHYDNKVTSIVSSYLFNNNLCYTNNLIYKWTNPIIYGTLTIDEYSSNAKSTILSGAVNLLDFDNFNSTYIIVNTYDSSDKIFSYDSYSYIFVAVDSNYEPDFYLGTDLTKKANCEGGLIESNLINKDYNIDNYKVYLSEPQYFNRPIRIDIDIN